MTDSTGVLAALVPALPIAVGTAVQLARSGRAMDRISLLLCVPAAAPSLALAGMALHHPSTTLSGSWYDVDARGAAFLAICALVGAASVALSPAYLRRNEGGFFAAAAHGRRWYYASIFAFWAVLLTIPITSNLGVAWLLVEASTATSALLVAHSGKRSALEAGWKYLVLTTIGLATALLGIVVLFVAVAGGHGSLGSLGWGALHAATPRLDHGAALLGFVLVAGGLAAKVGWAPVHHWLPDAHSEAPAPVSAMLSAALLPTVMLVLWRLASAVEPATGAAAVQRIFIGFGLVSLATAVPFLWRSLAWKRLLAYSSLEHVGVLALGIGFGNDLATAGVVLHLAGHALAKALGFHAATVLAELDPATARHAPRGLARHDRTVATAIALSLGTLTGLPPGPLFFSEVLILLGGVAAGQLLPVGLAVVLLALGFLGLAHVLVEGLFGPARSSPRGAPAPSRAGVLGLTAATGAGLGTLSVCAHAVPGSALVAAVMRAIT